MNSYTEVQLKVWEIVDNLYKLNTKLDEITISIFDKKYVRETEDHTYIVSINNLKFTTSKEFGIWNLSYSSKPDENQNLSVEKILERLKVLVRDKKINDILNG